METTQHQQALYAALPAVPRVYANKFTHRHVRMKSQLENKYAHFLDDCHRYWRYEPRQFSSGYWQWTPDFLVDGEPCQLVELKPDAALFAGDQLIWPEIEHELTRISVARPVEPAMALSLVAMGLGSHPSAEIVQQPHQCSWTLWTPAPYAHAVPGWVTPRHWTVQRAASTGTLESTCPVCFADCWEPCRDGKYLTTTHTARLQAISE